MVGVCVRFLPARSGVFLLRWRSRVGSCRLTHDANVVPSHLARLTFVHGQLLQTAQLKPGALPQCEAGGPWYPNRQLIEQISFVEKDLVYIFRRTPNSCLAETTLQSPPHTLHLLVRCVKERPPEVFAVSELETLVHAFAFRLRDLDSQEDADKHMTDLCEHLRPALRHCSTDTFTNIVAAAQGKYTRALRALVHCVKDLSPGSLTAPNLERLVHAFAFCQPDVGSAECLSELLEYLRPALRRCPVDTFSRLVPVLSPYASLESKPLSEQIIKLAYAVGQMWLTRNHPTAIKTAVSLLCLCPAAHDEAGRVIKDVLGAFLTPWPQSVRPSPAVSMSAHLLGALPSLLAVHPDALADISLTPVRW